MRSGLETRLLWPLTRGVRLACARIGIAVALTVGTAIASLPESNQLGVRFKILRAGSPATIEIRLTPHRNFDSVSIEAASGVATLTPTCVFSSVAIVAGGSYICRVDIVGKRSDAAMTLNVVARRASPGSTVPVTEVHHLSVKNSSFATQQKNAPASHHDVVAPAPEQR
jgi:hypothetical protein